MFTEDKDVKPGTLQAEAKVHRMHCPSLADGFPGIRKVSRGFKGKFIRFTVSVELIKIQCLVHTYLQRSMCSVYSVYLFSVLCATMRRYTHLCALIKKDMPRMVDIR